MLENSRKDLSAYRLVHMREGRVASYLNFRLGCAFGISHYRDVSDGFAHIRFSNRIVIVFVVYEWVIIGCGSLVYY